LNPVATPHIPQVWKRVWSQIRPAVERGGEHTEASVYNALMHGGMLLWYNKDAFAVTSWCDFPAGRIAYVLFAGGKNAHEWVEKAEDKFVGWAKSMNCKELRVIGRQGWSKLIHRKPIDFTYVRKL